MPHLLLVLPLAAGIAAWLSWVGGGRLSWDGAWYLTLASHLAETKGYIVQQGGEFHTKYAPGLPLLTALTAPIFGGGRSAATVWVVSAAFTLLALVCFGERLVSYRTRLLAGLLLVSHHLFLVHTALVQTEILFAASSFAFLVLLAAQMRLRSLLLVTSFVVACFLRPEGFLLLVSTLALPRNLRPNYRLLGCAVALPALWWALVLSKALASGSASYLHELRPPSLELVRQQLLVLSRFGFVSLFLLVTGALKALSTPLRTHVYLSASYLVVHLVWWFVDLRFYAAIIGSLALLAAVGVAELARSASARFGRGQKAYLVVSVVTGLALFEQIALLSAGERQLYQLDNAEYLTLYDPLDELAERTDWFHSECTTVLVPERVVYQQVLGRDLPIIEYRGRQGAQRILSSFHRPCLIVDMIHYAYWSSSPTERIKEVRAAGCNSDTPSHSSIPRSGYYLEVFRCEGTAKNGPLPAHAFKTTLSPEG